MTLFERIETNPKVMQGKPVIRGTHMPVELILRKLSEGDTESDLLESYPRLAVEDIAPLCPMQRRRLPMKKISGRRRRFFPNAIPR